VSGAFARRSSPLLKVERVSSGARLLLHRSNDQMLELVSRHTFTDIDSRPSALVKLHPRTHPRNLPPADLSRCHGRAEILRRNKAAKFLDRVNVPVTSREHSGTLNG